MKVTAWRTHCPGEYYKKYASKTIRVFVLQACLTHDGMDWDLEISISDSDYISTIKIPSGLSIREAKLEADKAIDCMLFDLSKEINEYWNQKVI